MEDLKQLSGQVKSQPLSAETVAHWGTSIVFCLTSVHNRLGSQLSVCRPVFVCVCVCVSVEEQINDLTREGPSSVASGQERDVSVSETAIEGDSLRGRISPFY